MSSYTNNALGGGAADAAAAPGSSSDVPPPTVGFSGRNTAVPEKDNRHGWSVADFERNRLSLTDFLKTRITHLLDAEVCRRILIRAPVKSGKREMVEYLAVRDHAEFPRRVHAFASAFHRMADEEQREELGIHNMEVFSLTKKASAERAVSWINDQIATRKQVVLHIDECDFGAGDKQVLAVIYKRFRDSPNVTVILYSATPQEVLFSGEVEEEELEMLDDILSTGERIEYTPPETFRGPGSFLDADLVVEAKPFFYKEGETLCLSNQGREIVAALRQAAASRSGRNIGVLRLSYCDLGGARSNRKENKAIYQFLRGWQTIPELAGFLVIADKGDNNSLPPGADAERIPWSSASYWKRQTDSSPILIVIDQTSSRSTEWKCHDRVNVYHDFRNTIVFSTISQAQERVNHYTGRYGSFQQIRVYGHKKTFLLSAGRISYTEYMHLEWEARKVDRRVVGDGVDVYHIRSTSPEHVPHPNYPVPLVKSDANRALQELGCFCDIKVSARVSGTVRRVRVYDAEFYPCTKETFSQVRQVLQAHPRGARDFQDPFQRSEAEGLDGGNYKGYLRGWRVLDFDADVYTQRGWGVIDGPRVTICYRDGVLGVALRYDTGNTTDVNTLETRRSMYGV